jgi:hypothetical protein
MTKYTCASNIRMIDVNPEIAKLDEGKIASMLTKELGIAYSETEKNVPDWEIHSHSLLLLGNHLVVSLLLRRPLN